MDYLAGNVQLVIAIFGYKLNVRCFTNSIFVRFIYEK